MTEIKKGPPATARPNTLHQNHTPKSSFKASVLLINATARSRWLEILSAAGMDLDLLDGKGHPCPKCLGEDRFSASKDVAVDGRIFCRHCFNAQSKIKPGDGIASIAWIRDLSNGEAARWIAEFLGIRTQLSYNDPSEVDIIESVARDKRMPLEAFKVFNAAKATRGKRIVARVPVYNAQGEIHSYFDMWPGHKGLCKQGAGSSGMFFPGRLPQPGETWNLTEGVKDAAALNGLGYVAAGMPTSYLDKKYASLFECVHVVIVPDLDTPGQKGALRSATALFGVASSVRIARLPGEIKETKGEDLRDILQKHNGVIAVREAIDNAVAFLPVAVRPRIEMSLNEGEVAEHVVKHLGKLGWPTTEDPGENRRLLPIYVRGSVLVQALESEDPGNRGQLFVRKLPCSILRERITELRKGATG